MSLIVSLLSNPAFNSLHYTYHQIYVQVALTLALIFVTVPKPKTHEYIRYDLITHGCGSETTTKGQ